ncbi:type II secretion system protein [Telmatocola sphagniphila]|uniref:Type II secretion system protein n=1 Tax=Telmatocola sphagniphila TaxID=1123043 RepID=A0A8E6EWN8_9BACT|nr:type II secretion system protein [Telmatocola sphagniphila]QVL30773.1 type II secretion system protein [Telmatocola sphagniphila]
MRTGFNKQGQRGFTLVELLVVLGIMVLLATLAILVVPSSDNRAAARAADQVQGWIFGAKNRAVRDQSVRGVRLMINDPTNPTLVTELQYLEQPEVYLPRTAVATPTVPAGSPCTVVIYHPDVYPAGIPQGSYIATIGDPTPSQAGVPLPLQDRRSFINPTATTPQPFGAGDTLEVNYGTTYRFKILGVARAQQMGSGPAPNNNAIDLILAPGQPTGGGFSIPPGQLNISPVTNQPNPPYNPQAGVNGKIYFSNGECRILRQPKPVIGEQPLLLPKGICIDLALSEPFNYGGLTGTNYTDILFGASGEVLYNGAPRVVLWVRSIDDVRWTWTSNNGYSFNGNTQKGAGSPTLISIASRTGSVGAHPVNVTPGSSPVWNPYYFLLDGSGDSGM